MSTTSPAAPSATPAAAPAGALPATNPSALAFERCAAAIAAVPASQTLPVNLDVPAVCILAGSKLSGIEQHQAAMLRLEGIDAELVTNLRDYVEAAWHAEVLVVTAGRAPTELRPLYEEGLRLRAQLLGDLRVMERRGVLGSLTTTNLGARTGFMDVASDLSALAILLREVWPRIHASTFIRAPDVRRAADIGDGILALAGARNAPDPGLKALRLQRAQAFTLLLRAWAEVRRGLGFLRFHHGDADKLTPSLFVVRSPRRKGRSATARAAKGAAPTTSAAGAPSHAA